MRLLDTRKLELVDVRDDAIPPYAILSHTWGAEEITLQELRHMKSRLPQTLDRRKRTTVEKKGFVKVRDAAALALKRGYSYIWIDTCCIDKTSSSELSEAINSMYQWYQQSAECYAILSDVGPSKKEDWAKPNSSLRRSRWFTRGWTLQELIAPPSVHFYAKDWTLLGHKNGPPAFMKLISDVTGISEEVLDGRTDALQLSISARMKWASLRHTTRLEDTAYCLMGLFQVNMPLLYGEGHRAFTRLQEEIIQRSDDQSLYAWTSFDYKEEDPDALSGLLAESPSQFKDAGEIQPLPPSPVYASAPSGMTNHGLRVQLYLRPILEAEGVPMEEDYYAILDCFVREGDTYLCPVLRLRRLSQDQYARLQTKSQRFLPPLQSQFTPEYEGYRTIYVRQQPIYYHMPQFRVSPIHMHAKVQTEDTGNYRLTEIFPFRDWNSTTMTMRAKYTRKLQALGLFRFQSPFLMSEKVDVVVGLRRLDAMLWEGWCFQRICRGNSPESTLSMVNSLIDDLTRTRRYVISSRMLRDSLGDDTRLVTDAAVEGLQLQGRLYISISISKKHEMQTLGGLVGPDLGLRAARSLSGISSPEYEAKRMIELTSACALPDALVNQKWQPEGQSAVRGRPSHRLTLQGDRVYDLIDLMTPLRLFVHDLKFSARWAVNLEGKLDPSKRLIIALFENTELNTADIENLRDEAYRDAPSKDLYCLAPVHWAAAGGSAKGLRSLISHGADPLAVTNRGWNVLHVSALCSTSLWDIFDTLQLEELATGRTKDESDTPLHFAAAYSTNTEAGYAFFTDFAERLISYSPLFVRNKKDETPLHRAAAFDNDMIIKSVVCLTIESTSAYIDIADRYGRSPLWHASATGACKAIMVLLNLGASINLADDMGRSPLHAACRGGHDEAVKLLLQNGASQDSETSMMELKPLDIAAMFGHWKCLRAFFDHSGSRSGEAKHSWDVSKALHIAASCGWLNCVELLCEEGADPFMSRARYFSLKGVDREEPELVLESFATVVEQWGDARRAAQAGGFREIAAYFGTSPALFHNRLGRAKSQRATPPQQGHLGPTAVRIEDETGNESPAAAGAQLGIGLGAGTVPGLAGPSAQGMPGSFSQEYKPDVPSAPIIYDQDYGSSSQSKPVPLSFAYSSKTQSVPASYSHTYEQNAQSTQDDAWWEQPPKAPFASSSIEPPSRVSSQSVTVPAFSSSSFQSPFGSRNTYSSQPSRYSSVGPQVYPTPASELYLPSVPLRQSSTDQQNSLVLASRPSTTPYAFGSTDFTSSSQMPAGSRWQSLPPPQFQPPPLHAQNVNQDALKPANIHQSTLEDKLMSMLGSIAPYFSRAAGPPTDPAHPALLEFDTFKNGPVNRSHAPFGSSVAVSSNGETIVELPALPTRDEEPDDETVSASGAESTKQSGGSLALLASRLSSIEWGWDRLLPGKAG